MTDVGKGFRLILPTEELLSTDEWQYCTYVGVPGESTRIWTGVWVDRARDYNIIPSLKNSGNLNRICRRKIKND